MITATKSDNGVEARIEGTQSVILQEYAAILDGLLRSDDLRLLVMAVTEKVLENTKDYLKERQKKRRINNYDQSI